MLPYSPLHNKRYLVQSAQPYTDTTLNAKDVNVRHPGGLFRGGPTDMKYAAPNSQTCPSWKIEKPYSPLVLVGNWAEERKEWEKADFRHRSIYGADFQPVRSAYLPDRTEALQTRLKNEEGIGRDFLFKNHKYLYDNNRITLYDENYNQRWREKDLPNLRSWNLTKLAWIPEKSDYPRFGPPTQFGLLSALKQKWAKDVCDDQNTYNTVYRLEYVPHSADQMVRRRATCTIPYHTVNTKNFDNLPNLKLTFQDLCINRFFYRELSILKDKK